jgi:hypothetical protein
MQRLTATGYSSLFIFSFDHAPGHPAWPLFALGVVVALVGVFAFIPDMIEGFFVDLLSVST